MATRAAGKVGAKPDFKLPALAALTSLSVPSPADTDAAPVIEAIKAVCGSFRRGRKFQTPGLFFRPEALFLFM
jgi:hypothetical protein